MSENSWSQNNGRGSTPLYSWVGLLSGEQENLDTPGPQMLAQSGSWSTALQVLSPEVAMWLCPHPRERQGSEAGTESWLQHP